MQKILIMQLDKELYNEIKEYCELNELKTRDFIHQMLKDAFLIEKYGKTPFSNKKDTNLRIDDENLSITDTKIIKQESSENYALEDFSSEKNIIPQNNFTHQEQNTLFLEESKKEIKKKRILK